MRSGTHLYGDLLSSHDKVMFTTEILHHELYPKLLDYGVDDCLGWIKQSLTSEDGYESLILEKDKMAHRPLKKFNDLLMIGAVIHKWQFELQNLNPSHLLDSFPDAVFLVLERKNKIKQYISTMLSATTGIWSVKDASKVNYENNTVEFDISHYLNWKQQNIAYYKTLYDNERLQKKSFNMYYESLTTDRKNTMCKVFNFIGLEEPRSYNVEYKKLQRKAPNDYISNWDDVSTFVERELKSFS